MSNRFVEIHNDISLAQGDIIENCRIICPGESEYHALLQENPTHVDMNYIECDCIIMSQSCDLENNKIKYVILCPIATLQNAMKSFELLKSKEGREQLRQGNLPSYHLLDRFTLKGVTDFYCVSFHNIFSVPKEYLKALVKDKNRLRLVSPYKEHLSQSFARYFMRVGLPSGIDKEELKACKFIEN